MTSPLKFEVDVALPSLGFREAQQDLASHGKRFGRDTLQRIPYSQLHLCCIGPAGAAACPPRLVREEKDKRIGRFVSLAPEELSRSERWLKAEGMYQDVMTEVAARDAPSWDYLKPRQRLVAKLFCLYNHIDAPDERILEAVALIQESAGDGVEPMLGSQICSSLVSLARRHLGIDTEEKDRIGDPEFREGIWKAMEAVLDVLPKEEQALLVREHIRDYSCTSDCFRAY